MSDVAPLFSENRDRLVRRLRLTSAVAADTVEAIDSSIQTVAIGCYDSLGEERVDQIRGYTYSDDPTSSAESRLRLKAAILEEKWVRFDLMRKLPAMFFEADAGRAWNEESLTREGYLNQQELERLWADVLEMLADLVSGSPDPATVSAQTFGPDSTPVYRPGGSILPASVGTSNG